MQVALVYEHGLGKGGYPRDVRWLATALRSHGVEVTFVTKDGDETEGLDPQITVMSFESVIQSHADIYHVFGIFLPHQMMLLRKLLRQEKLVALSPMGHLLPFHLKRNEAKKRLYLSLVKPTLRNIHSWHVFSRIENDSINTFWHRGVRTFEASLGLFPAPVPPNDPKESTDRLSILFFGRNDVYQKGIDVLLQGFAEAVQRRARLQLTIAGQPWDNSEHFIRTFVQTNRLGEYIRLLGPVNEEIKWRLISEADYLVFLSRWDGPPRPIREALSIGTPVIVSPETNMGHLVSAFGAGVQVRLGPQEVADALMEVDRNRDLREGHRDGALRLRERLDWGRVAQDYIAGYREMLKCDS